MTKMRCLGAWLITVLSLLDPPLLNAQNDPMPSIPQDFQCNATGVDSSNTTQASAYLAWDVTARRSNLQADGSFVNGALQHIRRCDLFPQSAGWYSESWGHLGYDAPSSWACSNSSIPRTQETTGKCDYDSFWTLPEGTKYTGAVDINGVECEGWEFVENEDTYALYVYNLTTPIALSKVAGNSATSGLFTIYFSAFVPGSPPMEAYDCIEGVVCPKASRVGNQGEDNHVPTVGIDSMTSLMQMMDTAQAAHGVI